jgi:hypothetical protein
VPTAPLASAACMNTLTYRRYRGGKCDNHFCRGSPLVSCSSGYSSTSDEDVDYEEHARQMLQVLGQTQQRESPSTSCETVLIDAYDSLEVTTATHVLDTNYLTF